MVAASTRALAMEDIASTVVENIPPTCCMQPLFSQEKRREVFRTLAYTERICKSFELAARRKIWEEQYGLSAVISMITRWVSSVILRWTMV